MLFQKMIVQVVILLVSTFCTIAQTYENDSLVVREILNMNGLDTVEVESVTSKISDRIYGLYLERTGISVLPESLGELDSLQNMQIQDNNLTALPQSIGNCTRLRYLCAYDNQIHELPESIANCTELDLLYLIRNKFTKFPTVLLQLKKLLTIDFGSNHLTEVPAEIAHYEQKIRLYINDNYLTELPEAFTAMEPELIHIAGNLICSRSEEMEQWLDTYDFYTTRNTNQSWRQYQGCDRQELEESVVQEILDENGLENLDMQTITESDDLGVTTLDLSAEIISLQEGLSKRSAAARTALILPSDIDSLKSLKTLNLSGNHLSILPSELHRLNYITSLDISGNNLTELPAYIVSFNNLERLDVSGNALGTCSEKLDTWLTDLDPDWKETQQTTRNENAVASSERQATSIALKSSNSQQLEFSLNAPQPARGSFSLYLLNGKKVFSTGVRTFHRNTTGIKVKKSDCAPGTCFAVFTTNNDMSTLAFAVTR